MNSFELEAIEKRDCKHRQSLIEHLPFEGMIPGSYIFIEGVSLIIPNPEPYDFLDPLFSILLHMQSANILSSTPRGKTISYRRFGVWPSNQNQGESPYPPSLPDRLDAPNKSVWNEGRRHDRLHLGCLGCQVYFGYFKHSEPVVFLKCEEVHNSFDVSTKEHILRSEKETTKAGTPFRTMSEAMI